MTVRLQQPSKNKEEVPTSKGLQQEHQVETTARALKTPWCGKQQRSQQKK